MKTKLKKGFAYFLMICGVWFLILGESLVDKEYILHNHYFIERLVVFFVLFSLGARYLSILEVRLEKYGRC